MMKVMGNKLVGRQVHLCRQGRQTLHCKTNERPGEILHVSEILLFLSFPACLFGGYARSFLFFFTIFPLFFSDASPEKAKAQLWRHNKSCDIGFRLVKA
jgi:hypothetical protein